jgi:hypothetical protein
VVIDSPVLVTSTLFEPVAMGIDRVGDVGLRIFFQGPGESLESSGEGNGVTSPIAVIIGLGIADPDGVVSALATASLTLDVRDRGRSEAVDDVLCRNEDDLSVRRLGLRIGVVGLTSVCMRSGAPEEPFGLVDSELSEVCWLPGSFCIETAGGGDGAIVCVSKCIRSAGTGM